jgi:hypothetical protein
MDIDPEDAFELANRNHQLCLKMKSNVRPIKIIVIFKDLTENPLNTRLNKVFPPKFYVSRTWLQAGENHFAISLGIRELIKLQQLAFYFEMNSN